MNLTPEECLYLMRRVISFEEAQICNTLEKPDYLHDSYPQDNVRFQYLLIKLFKYFENPDGRLEQANIIYNSLEKDPIAQSLYVYEIVNSVVEKDL